MLEIYEHRRVERRLTRLPLDILKRYEKWKDVVSISGPTGLRAVKGFHDEALRGKWRGHRSSRLGQQYRLPEVDAPTGTITRIVRAVDLITQKLGNSRHEPPRRYLP